MDDSSSQATNDPLGVGGAATTLSGGLSDAAGQLTDSIGALQDQITSATPYLLIGFAVLIGAILIAR